MGQYRETARPFGRERFARWRLALFARRRVHVVRRYSLPWLLAFGLLAAAGLGGAAFAPIWHELDCTRQPCMFTDVRLVGRRVRVATSVSGHAETVGSDDEGPRLLVQVDGEGPSWFADPRPPGGPIGRLRLGNGAWFWLALAWGAGFGLAVVLMALVRTRLVAHLDEGRLVVMHGSILGTKSEELPLAVQTATESVDDSEFDRLVLTGGGKRTDILASPRAREAAVRFLRACAAAKRPKRDGAPRTKNPERQLGDRSRDVSKPGRSS